MPRAFSLEFQAFGRVCVPSLGKVVVKLRVSVGAVSLEVFRLLYCAQCRAKRYHTVLALPSSGDVACNVCRTVRRAA